MLYGFKNASGVDIAWDGENVIIPTSGKDRVNTLLQLGVRYSYYNLKGDKEKKIFLLCSQDKKNILTKNYYTD